MALISTGARFDAPELATVIAALRLWQITPNPPEDIGYIACDGGSFTSLTEEQIEALIHRLNHGD